MSSSAESPAASSAAQEEPSISEKHNAPASLSESPPSEMPVVNTDGDVAAASAAEALMPAKPTALPTEGVSEDVAPTLTKEEMIEEALSCPCIASMKEGPCGSVFLEAYKCFLRSESSPQGMECMDHFVAMHDCMTEHPEEYDLDSEDDPFARKTPDDKPESSEASYQANAPVSKDSTNLTAVTDPPVSAEGTDPIAEHTTESTISDPANSATVPANEKSQSPTAPAVKSSPQNPIAAASPSELSVPPILAHARNLYRQFFDTRSSK